MVLLAWALVAGIPWHEGPDRFRESAVVSDSSIASQAGLKILEKGGNAVDAAVATGLALAVTFPAAGNIGGGGFMVVRMADGRSIVIDYRETAPRAASRDMYLDSTGKPVARASLAGYRASGVPGTVAGFVEAHRRFGKLPWRDVVEPARVLAEEGFEVSNDFAGSLKAAASAFKAFPESYRVFNRDGDFYKWGENFHQPELAKTLERIRDEGRAGFYEGATAAMVADDMKAHGGTITLEDLKNYKLEVREPLKGNYKGYEILTMPPPSSGGVCLLEMLNILAGFELDKLGWGSSGYDHVLVETMKQAFADRAEHLGDPGFVSVPINELTSHQYADSIRAGISIDRATPATEVKAGVFPAKEGDHTTHYSVVDKEGNAVANTYTLNTGFGSYVTVKGAGFLLNNEMDDFASKPGTPNVFGLIQGEKNAIAPGKRPLSSMTPTIVLREGKLRMVLGSPGGPTIINTVMQVFLNVVEFGMTPDRAVSAARIHHQWMPDTVQSERFGMPSDVKKAMEAKGHVFATSQGSMGSCHLVMIDPTTGSRIAGVDPRVSGAGAAGR